MTLNELLKIIIINILEGLAFVITFVITFFALFTIIIIMHAYFGLLIFSKGVALFLIFISISISFSIHFIILKKLNLIPKLDHKWSDYLVVAFFVLGVIFLIPDCIMLVTDADSSYLQAYSISIQSIIGIAAIYFAHGYNKKKIERNTNDTNMDNIKREIQDLKNEISKLKN